MADMHTEPTTENVKAADGAEPQPGGDTSPPEGEDNKPDEKTFTQAELDRVIQDRLEREKKKSEKAAEKAAKEAAEKALEDQAEWQKLAQTRQESISDLESRLVELEGVNERAEKYEKALTSYVDSLSVDLPASIQALLQNLDVVARMEWITANKAEAVQSPVIPGIPSTPKPADNGRKMTEEQRRSRAHQPRL